MSQAKHAEARELMYNGALLFFSYNQVGLNFEYLNFLRCVSTVQKYADILLEVHFDS